MNVEEVIDLLHGHGVFEGLQESPLEVVPARVDFVADICLQIRKFGESNTQFEDSLIGGGYIFELLFVGFD